MNHLIPQALLFAGPDKIGKFTLARLFSKSILCQSVKKYPCDECNSCLHIDKRISADYIIISKEEDKKNISIKQIRNLQQQLSLKSFETKYKIVIINDSEDLSEEASNALLKILEEPYAKIVFIIITSQLESIIPTIKSRCQIMDFNPLPSFQIENWLISRNCHKSTARVISRISNGCPGLAIGYFESHSLVEQQAQKSKKFLQLLQTNTISNKFSLINDYLDKSFTPDDVIDLLENWEMTMRDLIFIKLQNKNISNINLISPLRKISSIYGLEKVLNLYGLLNKSKLLIKNSVNNQLVLENLILNL